MTRLKELRYQVMLALYLPILLYAFSTFDLSDESFVVRQLEPVVVGEQTVVLGQPFTAQAYLTVAGSQGQELEAEGPLQTLGDSAFTMSTGQLLARDEQEKVVDYSGQFRFQQVDGEPVQIPVEGRFRVRRPEIVATSEATRSLYRQSLNQIRIDVPGLENEPLLLRSGGRTVEGRTIALSPAGGNTSVDVFLASSEQNDENVYLGQKEFTVIDPPRPELRVFNAGREVANGDNIPKGRAVLEFRVEPDEEFRRRYPRDARYGVSRATVYLRKGLTASQEIGTFDLNNGNRLVLTRALREAKAGDRITVRLERVYRINFAGTTIAVPFNRATRTFGFVLS